MSEMRNDSSDAKRAGHLRLVKSARTPTLPQPPLEVSPTLAKLRARFFLITDLLETEAQSRNSKEPDPRLKDILDGLRSLPRNGK